MSANPFDDEKGLKKDELDKLKTKSGPARKERPQTQRATRKSAEKKAFEEFEDMDRRRAQEREDERLKRQTGRNSTPHPATVAGDPAAQMGEPGAMADNQLFSKKLTLSFIDYHDFDPAEYALNILPCDERGIPKQLLTKLTGYDIETLFPTITRAQENQQPYVFENNLLVVKQDDVASHFSSAVTDFVSRSQFIPFDQKAIILDALYYEVSARYPLGAHLFEAVEALVELGVSEIELTILTDSKNPKDDFEEVRKYLEPRLPVIEFDAVEFVGQRKGKAKKTDDTRTHFLADHATDEDLLGYHPYAMGIASFVKDKDTALPLTIAIDGAWGKGKSSLMKMLRNELDPDRPEEETIKPHRGWLAESGRTALRTIQALFPRFTLPRLPKKQEEAEKADRAFITVFVNAWRHGHGTRLKATMVNEIIQSLTARLGPDFLMSLNLGRIDRIGLLNTAIKSMLTSSITLFLAIIFTAGMVITDIFSLDIPILSWDLLQVSAKTQTQIYAYPFAKDGIGAAVALTLFLWKKVPSPDLNQYLDQPDYLTLMGDDARVEEDFRRILSVLKDGGLNLALFVDDLDRCSPGECAAVVEALNTFFGQEKHECLFILGMHREMVASALEVAYKDLVDKINSTETLHEQRPFGRRFLEKIVQFIVALPEPDDDATKDFLDALTEGRRRGSLDDIKALEAAQARESDTPPKDRSKIAGILDDLSKRFATFGNNPFVASTEVIMEHLARKGVDIEQAQEEARKMGALKDRIEERKNANENDYVAAFKEVRDVIRANPRQYKRFFNRLRFQRLLNVADDNPMFIDACEAVLSLEHPELHYRIVKNAGSFAGFSLKVAMTNLEQDEKRAADDPDLLLLRDLDKRPGLEQLRRKLADATKTAA